MTNYIIWYRVDFCTTSKTRVQASDLHDAQRLAEGMFGRDKIISVYSE